MEPVVVSTRVRLDADAIRARGDLGTWMNFLHMEGSPEMVTWDDIYREIAKVVIGSDHYKRFSGTAQSDAATFRTGVISCETSVSRGEEKLPVRRSTVMPPAIQRPPNKA